MCVEEEKGRKTEVLRTIAGVKRRNEGGDSFLSFARGRALKIGLSPVCLQKDRHDKVGNQLGR